MNRTNTQCETAKLISLYGNKRVKRYCQNHKVVYTRWSCDIARNLPSIEEAIYHLELTDYDLKSMIKLNKLYHKTCRELLRRLKYDTNNKKGVK